jgi:hypothetical protein
MIYRLPFILFTFIFISSNISYSQGTRKFIGKLVSFDGGNQNIIEQPVRLVNQGTGVTGTDGIFVIAINENIAEVTLELVNSDLNIIYPTGGKISVPKDQDAVVAFVVGDSPKDILTKAVAKSNNEIKNRLSQLGVQQDGIEQALSGFITEIQKMSDIKLTDLTDQIELASKQEQFYPELASSITSYINEAKDLKDAFKFTARHAFNDEPALQILIDAIESYNFEFEKINKNHTSYEKKVADYWQSEAKASETKEFFNYALGEIHSANIFTLNLKVTDINNYNRGNFKGSKKSFKELILRDIRNEQLQLERRLEELDQRAQILLSKLAI